MCPEIHLFGRAVQSYYLCAALAGICWVLLCIWNFRGKQLGIWQFLLPILMTVCALIGARGLNVLLFPAAYDAYFPPWELSYQQLSLVGGLAVGILPVWIFSAIRKYPLPPLADAMIVPAAAGIVILKIGCFLNGCCFGKYTDGPLGVIFPANESAYQILEQAGLLPVQPHTVHPAQLYEIAGTLLALGLTLLLGKLGHMQPGGRFGLFAALFSAARLIILPFRQLPYSDAVLWIGYPLLYLAMIGVGIFLCIKWGRPAFGKKGDF